MLVIGTFSEEDERAVATEKVQFAGTCAGWKSRAALKRLSPNGEKPVKQIEFNGEHALDMSSVRNWREKVISSRPS